MKNNFCILIDDSNDWIKSFATEYLKSINRINAQKLIMNILKEDLKNKIHALEISID